MPSGTVTFLFSDIEGSTRLLRDLGAEYEHVLDDQRRLLREAIEGANGRIVDVSGDAVFAAFERAQDAFGAAVRAQREVAEWQWPMGAALRVRMGLHTGEPSVTNEGFVGLAVHKAARICAAGHGGQVLLSGTTRDLVQDGLPPDVVLLDVGEHQLKDFERPERITQLVIGGLQAVLKPIKTMETQPEETPFAGREDQLAEASQAALEVPETPTHVPAAHARGKLVDRVARWKHSFRARPGRRETLEALGIRLYGTSRIAPGDELRTHLATLGGALTKVARLAADADQLLGSSDRKALTRRLANLYAAPASERSVEAADVTAHHISCIDGLVERRREFDETSRELEPRLRALPAEIFQARLDHTTPPELTTEVTVLLERVQMLTASLEHARAELRACTSSTSPLLPSSAEDARDHPATVEVELFEEWQPRKALRERDLQERRKRWRESE